MKNIDSFMPFIKKGNFTSEEIDDFLIDNNINEKQLVKYIFKFLNKPINNDISIFIPKIVELLDILCKNIEFDKEEIESNKLKVKRTREKLLADANLYNSSTLLDSANKLDEIIIDKNINVNDLIVLIKELIDRNEDINIIKKIISINKQVIMFNNNDLFDYAFNLAINSIVNNDETVYYYITLLKIVYSSSIDKLHYIKLLNSKIDISNTFGYEIYLIIHGVKRGLETDEILEKYRIICDLNNQTLILPQKSYLNDNIITIDNNKTYLRDDGLSVFKDGNNYIVGIHISDAGSLIVPKSKVDNDALNNFKCMFLIGGLSTRLFNKNLENKLSLNEDEIKKILTLYVVIDNTGIIKDYYITENNSIIYKNLTYNETEQIIENPINDEISKSIHLLYDIASILENKNISKLEYWNMKKDANIIKLKSDTIVRELMVLYNNLLAQITHDNNIPYTYRVQNTEYISKLIQDKNIMINDYTEHLIRKIYLPSKYSTIPGHHNGLNIDIYSPSADPLRRYPDLYNQYLLHAFYFKDLEYDFNEKYHENLINYFNQRSEELSLMKAEYNREMRLKKK